MTEYDPYRSGERYDDLWWNLLRNRDQEAEQWLSRLNGQTVIDFGSGGNTKEFELFLKNYGAKSYIPVDKDSPPERTSVLNGFVITNDLLAAAKKRKPDNGFSISLNGINKELISSDSIYGKALGHEIIRLLHPEGLIFGISAGGMLKELSSRSDMSHLFISYTGVLSDTDYGYYFIAQNPLVE